MRAAGTLYRAMPQINERLTELCELSSRSRLVCDIALLECANGVMVCKEADVGS